MFVVVVGVYFQKHFPLERALGKIDKFAVVDIWLECSLTQNYVNLDFE